MRHNALHLNRAGLHAKARYEFIARDKTCNKKRLEFTFIDNICTYLIILRNVLEGKK